ncbi:hypothetical protein lerEdw1_007727 [Lerista edwardsae]|nr:hypothetical protein lerEdw1_007727 [Lerista edwardsae]
MTRGFVSGTWLTQSNWFPSDGALAGPCEALPAQENVSVGPNEPPPKSPGQTDGALSPADKAGSTPQNSASSLRESDACEGGSSAPSVSSARRRARPTRFSAVQLQELERIFQEQRYIETGDRQRLSKVLNLTPVQFEDTASGSLHSVVHVEGPRIGEESGKVELVQRADKMNFAGADTKGR